MDVIAQRAAIGKQIPEVSAALEEIGVPAERCGWNHNGKMVGSPKNHVFLGGDQLIEEKVASSLVLY